MEKEYYILNLNHSNSKNPCKLDNIIFRGRNYHFPFDVEDDELEDVYDSIEVLAEKTTFGAYKDVITKEIIISSNNGKTPELSFNRATPASRQDIIRITKIYKEMSDEDLNRYTKAIERIKKNSKLLYEREMQMEKEELSEERAARDFLLHYFV